MWAGSISRALAKQQCIWEGAEPLSRPLWFHMNTGWLQCSNNFLGSTAGNLNPQHFKICVAQRKAETPFNTPEAIITSGDKGLTLLLRQLILILSQDEICLFKKDTEHLLSKHSLSWAKDFWLFSSCSMCNHGIWDKQLLCFKYNCEAWKMTSANSRDFQEEVGCRQLV